MKQTLRTFSLAALSFCLALFLGCSAAVDPVAAENDIRQRTDEVIEAWNDNDSGWFERNVASGYLVTSQLHEVFNKEQILEYMSGDETDPPGTAEINDWQTIVNGDTAVSHYMIHWTFDSGGTNDVRITDVWCHRTGRWMLLSQHVSRISLTGSEESDADAEEVQKD